MARLRDRSAVQQESGTTRDHHSLVRILEKLLGDVGSRVYLSEAAENHRQGEPPSSLPQGSRRRDPKATPRIPAGCGSGVRT